MQYCYGDCTLIRALDEAEFWKRQEMEHTVVIRVVAPDLEPQYIQALCNWGDVFEQTEGNVIRYLEPAVRCGGKIGPEMQRDILKFLECMVKQSEKFVILLDQIDKTSAVANNPTAMTVVHHIRRESDYFIGVMEGFLGRQPRSKASCGC